MVLTPTLTFYRGDDVEYKLSFFSDTEQTIPLNITGYKIFFTMKPDMDVMDSQAALTKVLTTHSSATAGRTVLSLTNSDTYKLNPGNYYYDIQTKDGSGKVKTVVVDKVLVLPDVTRRSILTT